MQAIAFPDVISAETLHKTVLDTAWHLLDSHELTLASFVEMIALNAPNMDGASLFTAAINRALSTEAVRLARALVEQGLAQYPDNEQLHKYQRGIAPPKVTNRTPSTSNHARTMHWLSQHSHEYVGQWIAVQDGQLLGTGDTRQALAGQLGTLADQEDVMMVRVPVT